MAYTKVRSYIIFFDAHDRASSVYRDGNTNKLKYICVTICQRTFVFNVKTFQINHVFIFFESDCKFFT